VVVGLGALMLAGPFSSSQTARPNDAIRTGKITVEHAAPEKPAFDPASVPPPQGTIHRLDAISNSFMKR
jgi:hypothetical protein